MNCRQLHQDIATLTTQKEKLTAKLSQMNETMSGKPELKELLAKTEELENTFLEKYLDNFAEKSPEIFTWQFGEQIVGPESEAGYKISVNSIVPLPNGRALVGDAVWASGVNGFGGMTFEYGLDEHGEWEVWSVGDFKDKDGRLVAVHTGVPLPNGKILLGGGSVDPFDDDCRYALYEYGPDKDGEWELGSRITGVKNEYGVEVSCINAMTQLPSGNILLGADWGVCECELKDNGEWAPKKTVRLEDDVGRITDVDAATQLPSGNVLVGGGDGALREYGPDENGEWGLGPIVAGAKKLSGKTVSTMASLPNGNVLVGGDDGLYEYSPDANGNWRLEQRVAGVKDKDGKEVLIESIMPLPDNGALIGTDDGKLYECGPDENGEWRLGPNVTEFKDRNGQSAEVATIAKLSNGTILVGGSNGALRELKKPPRTVETLRQYLDQLS